MNGKIDRRALRGLLVAAALVAAGCTRGGSQTTELMPGAESSYRWVGQGEQGSFASAFSFCRQNMELQNFGALGPAPGQQSSAGSSTYNMPDVNLTAMPGRTSGYASRRSFDSCMRSQGWATAEQGAQPIQPQQPLPPSTTPGQPASPGQT